jgi:hypothetical protein
VDVEERFQDESGRRRDEGRDVEFLRLGHERTPWRSAAFAPLRTLTSVALHRLDTVAYDKKMDATTGAARRLMSGES